MSACLTPPPPDTGRVIVHLDADGFYAQCEELLDPSLRGRPLGEGNAVGRMWTWDLFPAVTAAHAWSNTSITPQSTTATLPGVTQKYLVVTCNYVAREFGVRKLMGIQEAQRLCPNLVLARWGVCGGEHACTGLTL